MIWNAMVVLLHFPNWLRRPDHWPTNKSVYQAANPVDRVIRRNLCAYTRTHECGLGGCSTPNRIFCVSPRGGKSVPGKPAETDGHGGAEHLPALEEIKLMRVVYATRQGTGISCAPPNHHHHSLATPNRPPNDRRVLSASVGVMESVPVLQPRSPRDVAPRRAVSALRLRMQEKERLGTTPSVPLTSYACACARRVGGKRKGRGWRGRTISSEILQIPLSAPVSPSHFPIYRFLFLTRHVSCRTRRTHVAALGGFGPEGTRGSKKVCPVAIKRAHPSAGDHHLGLRLVQLQKKHWMGCYNDNQKKKKRVLALWRERRSGSLPWFRVSYDFV